jgi:hypothetical protein
MKRRLVLNPDDFDTPNVYEIYGKTVWPEPPLPCPPDSLCFYHVFNGASQELFMTDQKRPRKKRKILWSVVLIVLLAGLVWFAYFRWSVSRRLALQIAVLESQGYPVTLDQLNDWYQLPVGEENAANYYMEAFACRVHWNRESAQALPFVGSASRPEPNSPFDPNVVVLMQAYLQDNAEAIQWLDQGAQCPHARYPVDYREGAMAPMSWLSDIRDCARLYAIQMLLAIERGKPDEFVRAFCNGMALADSLHQTPTLTAQLVRIACDGLLIGDLMERGLSRLELTDDQLIQLSSSLKPCMRVNGLLRGSAGEVCLILDGLTDSLMTSGHQDSGEIQWSRIFMVPYRILGLQDRDLCEYLVLTQGVLNPRVSTFQEFFEAGQLAEARCEAIPTSHLMFHLMSPGLGRLSGLYARYYAGQMSTLTALAVQRYRLKTQKLPDTLAVLVPEFLDEVTVDPFDGKPIRYINQGKTFRVYSVGEDSQDNGGRERDAKDRSKPFDQVFSVQYLE